MPSKKTSFLWFADRGERGGLFRQRSFVRPRPLYALNASTGAKLWSYTTNGDVGSSPAVANGVVYFGSFDDNVYALNASTGTKLWSFTTGDL